MNAITPPGIECRPLLTPAHSERLARAHTPEGNLSGRGTIRVKSPAGNQGHKQRNAHKACRGRTECSWFPRSTSGLPVARCGDHTGFLGPPRGHAAANIQLRRSPSAVRQSRSTLIDHEVWNLLLVFHGSKRNPRGRAVRALAWNVAFILLGALPTTGDQHAERDHHRRARTDHR